MASSDGAPIWCHSLWREHRSGASKPSIDSFPNDSPLELGEYTKHLKHRLARARRSIESLLVKEQSDTLFVKSLEDAEQVGERTTEPIH